MELFEKKLNEQFEIRNFNTKTDINNTKKDIDINNTKKDIDNTKKDIDIDNTKMDININNTKMDIDIDNTKKDIDINNTKMDNKNKKEKIEGFSKNEPKPFKAWIFEDKKTQVCYKNHHHKSSKCTYGLTNYADPYDMGSFDYRIFHLNYPPNSTLQDYVNWLYTYVEKEDLLPYNHLKNLEKIKKGLILIEEEGVIPPPSNTPSPLNTQKYFDEKEPFIESKNPLYAYNYENYANIKTKKK